MKENLAHELDGDYYEMTPDDLQTLEAILLSFSRKWLLELSKKQK